MLNRKNLSKGAVIVSVGLLLMGCSSNPNNDNDILRDNSKPVTGVTMSLAETPGEWVDALKVDENNKKKVNDFQVTTVSGECYFASETILGETIREEQSDKYRETSSVPYPSNVENPSETVGEKSKFQEGIILSEAVNKVYTPTKVAEGEKPLSYEVQSNEGELTFKGVTKKNSVSLVTTVNNGGTIQLTYGCNPGLLKNKDDLKSQIGEMVKLVDINIERS